MRELTIVWRNPNPVRRPQARNIQNYISAAKSTAFRSWSRRAEPWLTTSAFEVRASHSRNISQVTRRPGGFDRKLAGPWENCGQLGRLIACPTSKPPSTPSGINAFSMIEYQSVLRITPWKEKHNGF
jgi:hypothetical protein